MFSRLAKSASLFGAKIVLVHTTCVFVYTILSNTAIISNGGKRWSNLLIGNHIPSAILTFPQTGKLYLLS